MPETIATTTTTNPATGEALETYPHHTDEEVEQILQRAQDAFGRHRAASFAERAEKMRRVADLLDERKRDLGALMTREMGKPITQAVAEAEKCAWVCRYYADHAEAQLADEPIETEAAKSVVAYEPLGLILAVMPWNFPFWQVFRFAAPNLMAGNVGILKHAEITQGCARAIEDLFREAGFAEGIFQNLLVDHDRFAEVIDDRRVQGVTLTGSGRAGSAVAARAGRALKKTVLELGGSDPFLVLADADLDRAAEIAVTARNQNTGQSCIAAKRFLLERPIAEAFTQRFVERVRALKVGDPMDETTEVGPLARADLRDDLHDQVRRTVAQGAEILTGGEPLGRPGFYYVPTVLGGVEPGMVPFEEELFGLVAALVVVDDVDAAVEAANATPFGLGAAVFTADRAKGEAVARRLACGCAFVNEMVKSHPHLPFGGVKASGYGRELSTLGLREFVNAKTIWVD